MIRRLFSYESTLIRCHARSFSQSLVNRPRSEVRSIADESDCMCAERPDISSFAFCVGTVILTKRASGSRRCLIILFIKLVSHETSATTPPSKFPELAWYVTHTAHFTVLHLSHCSIYLFTCKGRHWTKRLRDSEHRRMDGRISALGFLHNAFVLFVKDGNASLLVKSLLNSSLRCL